MSILQTMRSRAPWLLGLFLIAQVAGVMPLLSLHAADAVAHAGTVFDCGGPGASAAHPDHDRGRGSTSDECCAVHHHLAGVLPVALDAAAGEFAVARLIAPPRAPIESAARTLPDKPPKPPPAV